jgi:hypothetical protein
MLRNLSPEDFSVFSDLIVENILATDMSIHFELLSEFNKMVDTLIAPGEPPVNDSQGALGKAAQEIPAVVKLPLIESHRLIISKIILHAADISNPCR